jgi:DNA mismatch repair protein MutL
MTDVRPPRIQVLPPELADQIAAGEVVERPASVVKELVENAIDAGARRIEVAIEGGGLQRIVVRDDGCGMTPEEAHLAVRRHATSKLRAIEDLFRIGTMGFRGEALPSIAAVSRLTLTTRAVEAPEDAGGYRLLVDGGVVGVAQPVGAPVGTEIVVERLLGNVPARLKFMKSQGTESGHVSDTIVRLALAHPHVHFKLRSDGRAVLDLPPHTSGLERARVALSRGRAPIELHLAVAEESGVHVEAYLGSPAEAIGTSRNTYPMVNRRFVRDRGLLQAIAMGYGELLEKGRYPTAVVHVTVIGHDVDVNVHPQKLEVRFARPQEVYAAVRHAIARAVAKAPWLAEPAGSAMTVYSLPPLRREAGWAAAGDEPRVGYGDQRRRAAEALRLFAPPPLLPGVETRPQPSTMSAAPPSPSSPPPSGRAAIGAALLASIAAGEGEPSTDGGVLRDARGRAVIPPGPIPPPSAMGPGAVAGPPPPTPAAAMRAAPEPRTAERFFSSLEYLGQLDRTYLVCEAPGELVLIDQHAAHERVAFQRLREAHVHRRVATQRLLLPLVLPVDERLLLAAREQGALLAELGFEVTIASSNNDDRGGELEVRAVPEGIGRAAPAEVLLEVLGELADEERGPAGAQVIADRVDHALATMACHSVVRAGDLLSHAEVRALLESMDGIDYRAHCPHGRPVLLRISIGELERRFGRT